MIATKDSSVRKEIIRKKRGDCIFLFVIIISSISSLCPAEMCMFPKQLDIYLIKGEILAMAMELAGAVLHE